MSNFTGNAERFRCWSSLAFCF